MDLPIFVYLWQSNLVHNDFSINKVKIGPEWNYPKDTAKYAS